MRSLGLEKFEYTLKKQGWGCSLQTVLALLDSKFGMEVENLQRGHEVFGASYDGLGVRLDVLTIINVALALHELCKD